MEGKYELEKEKESAQVKGRRARLLVEGKARKT